MKGAQIVKMYLPCSVQDLGRVRGKEWGVPMGGVMDQRAATEANALLGNKPGDAVLECGLIGPDIIFHKPTRIAICGANSDCLINGKSIGQGMVIEVATGDILKIGRCTSGRYLYVAVDGGILCEEVLDSRSYSPALDMGPMCADGFLPYGKPKRRKSKVSSGGLGQIDDIFLTVSPGPEFDHLSKTVQKQLFSGHFTVSDQCDRVGYRLAGMQVPMDSSANILSSGVFPGVVQLPPSGHPIVLMRDAPPTGGYPRILVVREDDLNRLTQKSPGDIIKFKISKGSKSQSIDY